MGDYKLSIAVSIFLLIVGLVFILIDNMIAGIVNIALAIIWLIIILIIGLKESKNKNSKD